PCTTSKRYAKHAAARRQAEGFAMRFSVRTRTGRERQHDEPGHCGTCGDRPFGRDREPSRRRVDHCGGSRRGSDGSRDDQARVPAQHDDGIGPCGWRDGAHLPLRGRRPHRALQDLHARRDAAIHRTDRACRLLDRAGDPRLLQRPVLGPPEPRAAAAAGRAARRILPRRGGSAVATYALANGAVMTYTIPIGPYHPALEEPYKVSVQCGGDTVQTVSVEVGYSFRGIELLAQRTGWVQDVTLIERVCGICSHVHTTTFCRAVETLAAIEVPARAVYIRTILCELERMHSHLLWAGLATEYIGFQSLFMEVSNLREGVMDLLESISGNRVHYGMNRIGGVNRDITDAGPIVAQLRAMGEIVKRDIVPSLMESRTAMARMRGVGVLTPAQANEWGVVGPIARASAIATDVRSDLPYLAYPELGFTIVTQPAGDVLARVSVRVLELLESIRLACEALVRLPPGPLRAFEGMP